MKLGKLFKGFRKEEPELPAGKPGEQAAASEPKKAVTPPPQQRPREVYRTVEERLEKREASVETIASMFGTIQSVLGEEEPNDVVNIPLSALLTRLPAALRGPAFDENSLPDSRLTLDRQEVLVKLRNGKVSFAYATLEQMIPAGWVACTPDQQLELDLPQVVASMPADAIKGARRKSQSYQEVENMRDLFTPRQAVKPAAPETAPPAAPEAAPVAPTPAAADTTAKAEPTETVPVEAPPPAAPAVAPAAPPPAAPAQRTPEAVPVRPRRFAPVGWNGTEQSLSAAAAGVDINTASVVDLESLPGVGPARASDIVEFRQKHGSFEHIYDLGRVPGIGANSFRQMTGLSLTSGRDRHCALNKLLGLAEDAAPSLPEIIRLFKERVNALGCVLSGLDGIPLAQNNVAPTQADEYAALSSQLFRRTSRYLRTIAGGEVDCLSLPAADPALLLFATDNAFLVISCRRDGLNVRDFRKAYAIAKEIGWLLSRRAVVRNV